MREVSEAQERLHRQQMEMEKVIGLIKFSDLILASPCRAACARLSSLSRFLALIHQHRDTLLGHLTHTHARDQGTALVLPKRLQTALVEILQASAEEVACEDAEGRVINACKGTVSLKHQTEEDRVSEECTRCQRYLEQAE